MKKEFLFAALFGLMTFTACDSEETVVPEPPQQEETTEEPKEEILPGEENIFEATPTRQKEIELGATQEGVSEGLNKFAWKVFSKIFEGKQEANLMVSPYSLSQVMMAFSNGLHGETLEEVKTTFEVNEFSKEDINLYFQQFNKGLAEADSRTQYRADNGLWFHWAMSLMPDFATNIKQYYNAETHPAAMNEETKTEVNEWVKERTYGRIPMLLDEDQNMPIAIMVNTVYFRGLWGDAIHEKSIKEAVFHNENGKEEVAEMMPYNLYSPYLEGETYQTTCRPFGNGAYVMDFILPKEGVSAQDALAEYMENPTAKKEEASVKLLFPKFEAESSMRLETLLGSMGIKRIFGANNPEIKLFDTSVFVSSIVQKTSITVDEKGTEAAAATYIGMDVSIGGGSSKEPEWIIMTLDRPFFYAIRETSTNTPLFIGYQGSVAK